MYRIYCRYEPGYRHLAGAGKDSWHWKRGAWRVQAVHGADQPERAGPVVSLHTCVRVICPTPRRVGTRCSPRKLLGEFLAHRRARGE